MSLRKNSPVFDLNRVDTNSSEGNEEECDRMTGKKRGQTLLTFSDERSDNSAKKKRELCPNETRPVCQSYQSVDDTFSARTVEETKAQVSSHKSLAALLEVVVEKLKEFNGRKIKNHNNSKELPANLREVVERKGGKNLKLVIEKQIYVTDLNEKNSRFQFPEKQIVCSDFLSQQEKESLKQIQSKTEKGKGGIDVTILIAPSLEEHNLKLREWQMKASSNYVLVSGWNSAIKHEKESGQIKIGNTVQLWSFRCHENKLWFLLHKVRD